MTESADPAQQPTEAPATVPHISPSKARQLLPRNQRNRIMQVEQAANLQRFAYDAGIALKKSLMQDGELKVSREDAMALGQIVKAWDTARDAVRILRGKGLPASVRAKTTKDQGEIKPLSPP